MNEGHRDLSMSCTWLMSGSLITHFCHGRLGPANDKGIHFVLTYPISFSLALTRKDMSAQRLRLMQLFVFMYDLHLSNENISFQRHLAGRYRGATGVDNHIISEANSRLGLPSNEHLKVRGTKPQVQLVQIVCKREDQRPQLYQHVQPSYFGNTLMSSGTNSLLFYKRSIQRHRLTITLI